MNRLLCVGNPRIYEMHIIHYALIGAEKEQDLRSTKMINWYGSGVERIGFGEEKCHHF